MGSEREALEKLIAEAGKISAKVGFFESAKYPDGTPIAMVAQQNEFGVPEKKIPPRPFMRPTMDGQKSNWKQLFASGVKAAVAGRVSVRDVFEGLGGQAAGDCRKTISQLTKPPLSPVTVMLRKIKKDEIQSMAVTPAVMARAVAMVAAGESTDGVSDKPLVDTGAMIASLTHVTEVE